jgi:hypothetical protein
MYNAWQALKYVSNISKNDKLDVLVASLLHDADDG